MIEIHKIAVAVMMLSPVWIPAPAKADYKASFNSGRIPKDMTASNANSLVPSMECYAAGYTAEGWTVDRVGTKGYCAVSPTHTRSDVACENVLSLPELLIEKGWWLRWDALSVSPDFPEAYDVVARSGDVSETLLSVDSEAGEWTTHVVSLDRFAGKNVRIDFVCRSVNRFMLAVSDLSAGVLSLPRFKAVDSTPRFAGILDSENLPVKVSAVNNGADQYVSRVECVAGNGELYGSEDVDDVWKTGETRSFEFDMPLSLGERQSYAVDIIDENNGRTAISEGCVDISYFSRKMLVDEGTGMWCQNCPDGIVELENLHRELRDNVVTVATHCSADQDPLTNDAYWQGLGFYAAPYFKLDRIPRSSAGSTSGFSDFYDRPVEFRITISGLAAEGNDAVTVRAFVETALPVDNSADNYRVGYVMTSDFYRPDDRLYYQQNGIMNPTGGRFYFMPRRMPGDLIRFHDVSLTSENAFAGIAGSLPAEMEPGSRYEFSWTVDRPELLENLSDGNMVVYLIDSSTGEVCNADSASIGSFSSVGVVSDGSSAPSVRVLPGGMLGVDIPSGDAFEMSVYDMTGAVRATYGGVGETSGSVVRHSLPSGVYVAVVTAGLGSCSSKLLITNSY